MDIDAIDPGQAYLAKNFVFQKETDPEKPKRALRKTHQKIASRLIGSGL